MKPTRSESLLCCHAIQGIYAAFDGWEYQGRPREDQFHWPETLIWGESKSYERRPGPRDRYHWVTEWAPIAKVVLFERTLYVAFRGTGTRHEWSNNFRFPQRRLIVDVLNSEIDFGRVHDGFADIFESLLVDLVDEVAAFSGKADRVIVTGHSLGGALATLAMVALNPLLKHAQSTTGVVFGCPRVGSIGFAEFFATVVPAGSFFRYEMCGDVVVELPWEKVVSWAYRHVGHALPLKASAEFEGKARESHFLSSYRQQIATEQE